MNGPRFNHFWHYLLDLHNLTVENRVKIVANPLTSQRLSLILEELEKQDEVALEEDDNANEDLVTTIYYEETSCDCSRKSKCKTKNCKCYTASLNCTEKCSCSIMCTNK